VNWRWEPMKNLPNLIVPFKRRGYDTRGQGIRGLEGGSYSCETRLFVALTVSSKRQSTNPYRPNGGNARFNHRARVAVGRRSGTTDRNHSSRDGMAGRRAESTPTRTRAIAVMRELGRRTGWWRRIFRRDRWIKYEFPPTTDQTRIAWPSPLPAKKWSRCASRPATMRSTVTTRNGQPADSTPGGWERLDRVARPSGPFRREVYRMGAREFDGVRPR